MPRRLGFATYVCVPNPERGEGDIPLVERDLGAGEFRLCCTPYVDTIPAPPGQRARPPCLDAAGARDAAMMVSFVQIRLVGKLVRLADSADPTASPHTV